MEAFFNQFNPIGFMMARFPSPWRTAILAARALRVD